MLRRMPQSLPAAALESLERLWHDARGHTIAPGLLFQICAFLEQNLLLTAWGSIALALLGAVLCDHHHPKAGCEDIDIAAVRSAVTPAPTKVEIEKLVSLLDKDDLANVGFMWRAVMKLFRFVQTLIVLSPVLVVCLWVEWADWTHVRGPCPGLQAWAIVTGVLTPVIMLSYVLTLASINASQAGLRKRSEDMSARLCIAEAKTQSGELDLSDLRKLMDLQVTTMQSAYVFEKHMQTSIFSYLVAICTAVWLLMSVFNAYLGLKHMVGPSVFPNLDVLTLRAMAGSSENTAWVIACASIVALLFAASFLVTHVLGFISWATGNVLCTDSVSNESVVSAPLHNSTQLAMSMTQLFVKSFPFGPGRRLAYQCALLVPQRQPGFDDARRRLIALKLQLESRESKIKQEQDVTSLKLGDCDDFPPSPLITEDVEAVTEQSQVALEQAQSVPKQAMEEAPAQVEQPAGEVQPVVAEATNELQVSEMIKNVDASLQQEQSLRHLANKEESGEAISYDHASNEFIVCEHHEVPEQ